MIKKCNYWYLIVSKNKQYFIDLNFDFSLLFSYVHQNTYRLFQLSDWSQIIVGGRFNMLFVIFTQMKIHFKLSVNLYSQYKYIDIFVLTIYCYAHNKTKTLSQCLNTHNYLNTYSFKQLIYSYKSRKSCTQS